MSNESTVWKNLTESTTIVPQDPGEQDGYVLLLVLLSIFLGGSLVLLSVLLVVCRRCCEGGRCISRDDPEKTNAAYLDESQPVQAEITIRVDESDCVSASSCHDVETERFLSTGTTGRRVSFNEAALFDHGKKTQEKGRRYTLTEGDFHHLKNARLTHLHLPPSALKIVTIHECESSENSITTMVPCPAVKPSLSIFQPPVCALPQTALTSLSISPSSPLPGDSLNSMVDRSFSLRPPSPSPEPSLSLSAIEVTGARSRVGSGLGSPGDVAAGPVLQFFTKLRRHASLEGASPYFKIKRWKLDSSQRASSLDTRGSPKRRQFQRQRAASESMDQEEHESHHVDIIQYIARRHDDTPASRTFPAPGFLSPPSTPPPSLGRLEVEVMVEPSCSRDRGVIGASPEPQEEGAGCRQESLEHQTLYRDIWTLRASLEQYASSDQSSNNDKDSVRSDADSVCSLGGGADRRGLPSYPSQDIGDEQDVGDGELNGEEDRRRGGKQDSVESEKGSDGESGNRKLLQMDSGYASIEAPCRAPEEQRLFGSLGSPKDKTASEKRHFFTSSGRKGTVCESFEASLFEEELEDEAAGGGGGSSLEAESPVGWSPYGQMFAPPPPPPSAPPPPLRLRRRDYSIDEKTDALFHEFLRHDPQFDQQESPLRSKHRTRVHLRKQWQRSKQYSDPGVRLAPPLERLRAPLCRGDSVSYPLDTGFHSTLPRIVSGPDEEAAEPDGTELEDDRRKASPSSSSSSRTIKEEEGHSSCSPPPNSDSTLEPPEPPDDGRHAAQPPEAPDERVAPPPPSYGPQTITAELSDKLTASLEERLYTGLRKAKDSSPECVLAVSHASPDHSPV